MSDDQGAKSKILNAAKKEFAQRGYAGARMNNIAEQAGVNKAMLHYYFNSKENLYLQILQNLFSTKFQVNHHDIQENLKQPLSHWEKFYTSIYLLVSLQFEFVDTDFHQIMAWEMAEGRKRFSKFAKKFLIPRLKTMEEIIDEGTKAGVFATKNSLLFVMDVLSLVMFYTVNRSFYAETELYDKLYGNDPKKNLLNFIVSHFSKALSPTSGEPKNFEISSELMNTLDSILKEMKLKGEPS